MKHVPMTDVELREALRSGDYDLVLITDDGEERIVKP